jgi:chemotaxis family two-component system sensor kinase Cph1
MQTLIQDLLAFSRAGRAGMEIQTVDCNALLEAALFALHTAMEESHVQVIHGDLPTVEGNRVQLQQVLQNLLGNAIKFHGSESPVIQVEAKRLGNEWFFSVSDNGIGIAPEHRDSIFTVFTRLHTRAEYPGNGIGLAICKKIVEQHRGRIWVEPQGKAGTTFTFTLPVAGVAGQAPYNEETRSDEHAPSLVSR